jgi:hypothetical protein
MRAAGYPLIVQASRDTALGTITRSCDRLCPEPALGDAVCLEHRVVDAQSSARRPDLVRHAEVKDCVRPDRPLELVEPGVAAFVR